MHIWCYCHGIVIDILKYICIWCTVDWKLPYFSVMNDIVIDIISQYWLSIEHHCCSVSTASCCSLVWCKSNSLLVCILLMCRFTDGLNHKCFKLTWNISCDSAHCNLSRLTYLSHCLTRGSPNVLDTQATEEEEATATIAIFFIFKRFWKFY